MDSGKSLNPSPTEKNNIWHSCTNKKRYGHHAGTFRYQIFRDPILLNKFSGGAFLDGLINLCIRLKLSL
jgi:hypothetical protein